MQVRKTENDRTDRFPSQHPTLRSRNMSVLGHINESIRITVAGAFLSATLQRLMSKQQFTGCRWSMYQARGEEMCKQI